jgi:CheY-like chemotaxis protein
VRQLTGLGYRVLEAESAVPALKLMGVENVNLLLTDIVMPGGIDGLALARQACQRWPTLKVVFTSGFTEAQVDIAAQTLPADARLLIKPYRREQLAMAIRTALDA